MSGKLKSWPQTARLEALQVNEKIIANTEKKLALMRQLQPSIIARGMDMDEMTITPNGYLELLDEYHRAAQKGQEQFTWNGHEFVTGYAKYLLEYLWNHLAMGPDTRRKAQLKKATHERLMHNRRNTDGS